MNEIMHIITGFSGGILLGLFFFWGLRFTLKKGLKSKNPALWFLMSFLVRVGIVVAGFYFIAGGNWKILLACLAGFTVSRFVVQGLGLAVPAKKTD